jgi:NADPH:quinone reductase-like Zn-dependent oxidoreductase
MRAAVAEEFGPPEVLHVRDRPRPRPGRGEILVRVVAAGVNPVDAGNRRDGSGARIAAPLVVGSDASGVAAQLRDDPRGAKPVHGPDLRQTRPSWRKQHDLLLSARVIETSR